MRDTRANHPDPYGWWQEAVKAAKAAQRSDEKWLVMVYLAGDNNLTEEMVPALQALQLGGPPTGDKIVAQFDPSGLGLPTQRYDLSTSKGPHLSDHLEDGYQIDDTNTGNPQALAGFIKWAYDRYAGKTQRCLLILSGHGSGTTEDFLLQDDNSMDALSIQELELALADATGYMKRNRGKERIDILGMDACFMSMFEVCYQIRKYVDILVGAEGLEPEFGWPYGRILAKARQWRNESGNRAMDAESLAKVIVTEYVEHYSDYDRSAGRSADLAAVRLVRMEELGRKVNELADLLTQKVSSGHHDKVTLAHWSAQTYKFDQYVDLKDFCEQVTTSFPRDRQIVRTCDGVIALLGGEPAGGGVVLRSGCSGFAYQHSYGLSIYFPWALVSPEYGRLAFSLDYEKWLQFIEKQVEVTRRDARPGFASPPPSSADSSRLGDLAGALARNQIRSVGRLLGVAPASPSSGAVQLDGALKVLEDSFVAKQQSRFRQAIGQLGGRGVPADDAVDDLFRRGNFGLQNSRYTTRGSRYTTKGSRYTTRGSRSPADREASVKNLPPVIGKDYWPP